MATVEKRVKRALQSFECPDCNFIVHAGDDYMFIDYGEFFTGICLTCSEVRDQESTHAD